MKNFFWALIVFCAVPAIAQQNQKFISINGTSELIRPANQIEFFVKIRVVDATIEGSKKTNDKYVNELMTILKNIEIDSHDIDVSPVTLGKNYEYLDREIKQNGFYTEVHVSFLLKDLSKYYELTNKIASSNAFEIVNSSYGISDYELQHKLAYEQALKAAKEKSEYMVKTLGTKLGEVLEIVENDTKQSYSAASNTISIDKSSTGDLAGKVTIKRSVRVKFAIN